MNLRKFGALISVAVAVTALTGSAAAAETDGDLDALPTPASAQRDDTAPTETASLADLNDQTASARRGDGIAPPTEASLPGSNDETATARIGDGAAPPTESSLTDLERLSPVRRIDAGIDREALILPGVDDQVASARLADWIKSNLADRTGRVPTAVPIPSRPVALGDMNLFWDSLRLPTVMHCIGSDATGAVAEILGYVPENVVCKVDVASGMVQSMSRVLAD